MMTFSHPQDASSGRKHYYFGVNLVRKMLAVAEGAWASKTVKLAPEPPGSRQGVVGAGEAISFVTVGDSLVAGCGVSDQSEALTPLVASEIARKENKSVAWETHAKLGATMRRVRYRYLAQLQKKPDILLVCAGSNDVMARRGVDEWTRDLNGALDEAQALCNRVWLLSSGQPHNSPVLPRTLRRALEIQVDEQTAASAVICQERGIPFVNVTHVELPTGFWATDGFHPSGVGYEFARDKIISTVY